MPELMEMGTTLSSPFAFRVVQPRIVSLQEAENDAIQTYYGSLTWQTLFSGLVAMIFIAIMGYNAVNDHSVDNTLAHRVAGYLVLIGCAAGLAYVIYEYRRKQRILILE